MLKMMELWAGWSVQLKQLARHRGSISIVHRRHTMKLDFLLLGIFCQAISHCAARKYVLAKRANDTMKTVSIVLTVIHPKERAKKVEMSENK